MVNNAGVGGAFGPITEVEVEDWDYSFDVLARSVFLGIKHAARLIRPRVARATGESVTVDGGMMAAGPRLRFITDAGSKGLVGVNRGTTGQEAVVRRRVPPHE
jgi:NAD(P)-dependent dehydrogenase (short-subunit alcohol dehydrogenase family)